MRSIVIAAPHSGSGKTTITLGIMECLRRRGLRVAPFKVGPDFIDPGYHRLVTGSPSINLDGWMCSPEFVRETFAYHCSGAELAVIEGVMGLFDGVGGAGYAGSTAQVAALTGAPVVLVVDAKSMAGSAAALVKGFAEYDQRVQVVAVIFNNVASENHGRMLREAMGSLPMVKVIGCMPRDARLHIPSRHLGLVTAEENPLSAEFLDLLADTMEHNLDLDALCSMSVPMAPAAPNERVATADGKGAGTKIAVAHDAAFCFVYEDNLRLLERAGAEVVEFSPLDDEHLPTGIAGIYLPGGYPELFAERLGANRSLQEDIRMAVEGGMPVYAECGGLIYLTKGLIDGGTGAVEHHFVGVFPMTASMLSKRKALGYREVETLQDSLLGKGGLTGRGHEFHYSELNQVPHNVERIFRVHKGAQDLGQEGFRYKNCLASYIHLHFGSCPQVPRSFVMNCNSWITAGCQERKTS